MKNRVEILTSQLNEASIPCIYLRFAALAAVRRVQSGEVDRTSVACEKAGGAYAEYLRGASMVLLSNVQKCNQTVWRE